MIDNGILTFTTSEMQEYLTKEPGAKPLFRQFLGGDEFINGFNRWVLYLADADPATLRSLPLVMERMKQLKAYRAASDRPGTKAMAEYPTKLGVDHRLNADFLVIPNTSSERRDYIPIGWMGTTSIANQTLRILTDASRFEFGILTSRQHVAWLAHIGGRLKSDYRYSNSIVYNTFPWPDATPAQRAKIEGLAQAVLDARDAYPTSSLADLYDPDTMPADCAAPMPRWIARWTGSTARPRLKPTATGWNICSAAMRRWSIRWNGWAPRKTAAWRARPVRMRAGVRATCG